jgi:prevent-host-death family protein
MTSLLMGYDRNMTSVGAFDAKTHLNELLQRASKGETIRITRRGVPVAKLVPPDDGEKKDVRELADSIRELRKGARLGKASAGENSLDKLTIRELIDDGRRY